MCPALVNQSFLQAAARPNHGKNDWGCPRSMFTDIQESPWREAKKKTPQSPGPQGFWNVFNNHPR